MNEDYQVIVYTQDGCKFCGPTKAYLRKNEIDFAEINISDNPIVRDLLIESGYREMPVVEWTVGNGSGYWTGFSVENIEALKYLIED